MREQDFEKGRFSSLRGSLLGLGALVLSAIVGTSYWLAYRPLSESAGAARQRSAEIAAFIGKRPEIVRRHADVHQQLRDHHSRMEELLNRIPSNPDEASFLAQLSELSNDAGVRIREFDPGVANDSGKYANMEIDIVAEASYEALCRFLDGLTKLPRLSEVTALSLNDVDSTAPAYPIRLTLRVYYAPLSESEENLEAADRA